MAKKDFFLIVDTETTMDQKVADFGAVIVDRQGKEYARCAVLVNGIFTDMENHPLFHDNSTGAALWSKSRLTERYNEYNQMVANGQRMIASVAAINKWLLLALAKYNPILTAYNISFDLDKCTNTGIDLSVFDKKFCLWYAAFSKYHKTKKYRQFVLDNHCFNAPTKHGNMSFVTNAETMTRFVTNNPLLEDEPHTALEDVLFYELPILLDIVNKGKRESWMNPTPFNWRAVQVKDWFTVK